MSEYKSFETERLILKPSAIEDAPFIFELLNTPKWIKHIGDRNVKSVAAAEQYIKDRMLPQLDRLGFGNYMIIRKSDNKMIGSCGLYDREGLDGVDIGFAFLPEYERKGYGFEAAQKIKEVGFEVFGVKKILGITNKENIASQKLLKKLGLEYIRDVQLLNDPVELMLFELEA